MRRIKWIDRAKGIAILLVILGHVSGSLEGSLNFKWVYGIHLVMFFLISGYLSRKKEIYKTNIYDAESNHKRYKSINNSHINDIHFGCNIRKKWLVASLEHGCCMLFSCLLSYRSIVTKT